MDAGTDARARRIDPWLRDILRCPACRGTLHDGVTPAPEATVELRCAVCRLAYPVQDGIPVLLVDEARPFGTEE